MEILSEFQTRKQWLYYQNFKPENNGNIIRISSQKTVVILSEFQTRKITDIIRISSQKNNRDIILISSQKENSGDIIRISSHIPHYGSDEGFKATFVNYKWRIALKFDDSPIKSLIT